MHTFTDKRDSNKSAHATLGGGGEEEETLVMPVRSPEIELIL